MKPTIEVTHLQSQAKISNEHNAISPLTYQVYDAISSAEYGLSSEVEAEIVEDLYEMDRDNLRVRLENYNFSFQGALQIVLQGKSDGTIAAKVGGFGLRVYAKVKDKRVLVPISATITVTTDPIWLDATYDMYTGELSDFVLQNINYHVNVSSSWLNPFSPLIKNKVKNRITKNIENSFTELQESLVGTSYSLLGLDELLPSGTLVLNNVDVGQKAKHALNNLLTGEFLTISMLRKNFYYTNGQQHHSADVTLNLSNNYHLKLFNHLIIGTYWQHCDFNTGLCDEVP